MIYRDTATIVVVSSGAYADKKTVTSQNDVSVIFLQDTGYIRNNSQEAIDSDATCYVDPDDAFVLENFNRLEGMYVVVDLYGEDVWYKVTKSIVNRHHLLNKEIDNIQLLLKKTTEITGVS